MYFSSELVRNFWYEFLSRQSHPEITEKHYLEAFSIGTDENSANSGAELIKRGTKTATSQLVWTIEAHNSKSPSVGDLSIVLDGKQKPVCVVETTWTEIIPFSKVDKGFALEYGEWDRTLKTWREICWRHYSKECLELGTEAHEDMPILCERFRVVHPV